MAILLDVRSEAIRWESEGLQRGVSGRSHSVPSDFGLQYSVQGGPKEVATAAPISELQEMREMLRLQQEQLNNLIQSLAALQNPQQLPRRGPINCRRCQQPGHYASDMRWGAGSLHPAYLT